MGVPEWYVSATQDSPKPSPVSDQPLKLQYLDREERLLCQISGDQVPKAPSKLP